MYIASRDLDNNGETANYWVYIDPKSDASTGYVTANSNGSGTDNKSVHINANHKLIERRLYVSQSAAQDEPQWTDSWKGKTQATGEYADDEAEGEAPRFYICGLLSRYKDSTGENCYIGRKGIKFQMPQDKSTQYADWTKDIRNAIQSGEECDSNTLSFILCPLLDGMQSAVYYLIGQPGTGQGGLLGNLLTIKPLSTEAQITVPKEGGGTEQVTNYTLEAWARIRDVSLGFMILIFIVIIFGNGVGLDAYTVKRAIPRLAMGSLFTFASFYLLQTLIDLSNVLGRAVPTLLWAASPGGSSQNGFAFDLNFGAGGGLVAIVLLLILYFLALLAILVGIAGLIVRQLVIYALVLTAPIAFVAWVLPNTEKLFKKWWSNLIKVLMMYPIVTGMLAIAILFQNIVGKDSTQPFSVRLVGVAAPLLALMAIPKTFKMGGDLFANGASFVAGRVSKGTDAVKGKAVGAAKGVGGKALGAAGNAKTLALNKAVGFGSNPDDSRGKRIAGAVISRTPGIGGFTSRKRAQVAGKRQVQVDKYNESRLDGLNDKSLIGIYDKMSDRQRRSSYGQAINRKLSKSYDEQIANFASAVKDGRPTTAWIDPATGAVDRNSSLYKLHSTLSKNPIVDDYTRTTWGQRNDVDATASGVINRLTPPDPAPTPSAASTHGVSDPVDYAAANRAAQQAGGNAHLGGGGTWSPTQSAPTQGPLPPFNPNATRPPSGGNPPGSNQP